MAVHLSVSALLLGACVAGVAGGDGWFLAAKVASVRLDDCGCKIGEEGWSNATQQCLAGSETSQEEAAACATLAAAAAAGGAGGAEAPPMNVSLDECGCRPGQEGWSSTSQKCLPESRTSAEEAAACLVASSETPCLCVFDIDRTLTGKQGEKVKCPDNKILDGLWDSSYGGGTATLSALAAQGIDKTFCNECYLGICSTGSGSGAGSPWNNYILNKIMRSEPQEELTRQDPAIKIWSYGTDVHSPYVLDQPNKEKQVAVEGIRLWYGLRGIEIPRSSVYFFGDRTENIPPFAEYHLNSKEVSCGSRDLDVSPPGMIGYCGAIVAEIQRVEGNHICPGL